MIIVRGVEKVEFFMIFNLSSRFVYCREILFWAGTPVNSSIVFAFPQISENLFIGNILTLSGTGNQEKSAIAYPISSLQILQA